MVDGFYETLPDWMTSAADLASMCTLIVRAESAGRRQLAIDAARRGGHRIEGPDFLASRLDWSAEGGAIRAGLRQIVGLSVADVAAFDSARHGLCPGAVVDRVRGLHLERHALLAAVRSGLFDSVVDGLSRPQFLWLLLRPGGEGQGSLFPPTPPFCLAAYSRCRRLADEFASLGLLISAHPVELVSSRAARVAARFRAPLVRSDALLDSASARVLLSARLASLDRRGRQRIYYFEDAFGAFMVDPTPPAAAALDAGAAGGALLYLLGGVGGTTLLRSEPRGAVPVLRLERCVPLDGAAFCRQQPRRTSPLPPLSGPTGP